MDTSKKSWHEFRNSEQQHQSYAAVIKVLNHAARAMTGREICSDAGQEGLWKRLSEMERLGWVICVGKRECTVTHKTSKIWRLTTPKEFAVAPAYEGEPIELPGLREVLTPAKIKSLRQQTILDEAVS